MIHCLMPPYHQKGYIKWNQSSFLIKEKIHNEVLSLPMSLVIIDDEVSVAIRLINAF